jgi:hypothetical protein
MKFQIILKPSEVIYNNIDLVMVDFMYFSWDQVINWIDQNKINNTVIISIGRKQNKMIQFLVDTGEVYKHVHTVGEAIYLYEIGNLINSTPYPVPPHIVIHKQWKM